MLRLIHTTRQLFNSCTYKAKQQTHTRTAGGYIQLETWDGNQRYQPTMLNHLIYSIRLTCVVCTLHSKERPTTLFDQAFRLCVRLFLFQSMPEQQQHHQQQKLRQIQNTNLSLARDTRTMDQFYRLFA